MATMDRDLDALERALQAVKTRSANALLNEQSYLAGDKPKGEIKLESIYCPTPEESPDFEFTLYALPYEFTCRADSQTELQEWIETLQQLPEL